MADTQDLVYTVPEVATILKVSKASVYRMIQAGELEAVKIRADLRIPGRAIRALLGEEV